MVFVRKRAWRDPAARGWRPVIGLLALGIAGFAAPAAAGTAYQAELIGVEDAALESMLREVSDVFALIDEPPATPAHLRRRARRDAERFLQVLHSAGHYGATARFHLDDSVSPLLLRFEIEPDEAYPIGKLEVRLPPDFDDPAYQTPTPEQLGLPVGAAATAEAIIAAEGRVAEWMREQGYPFPQAGRREVIVDHRERWVEVVYPVTPGPKARYGPVTVEGLERVLESTVRSRITLREGAPYRQREVTALQNALYGTNLFSVVRITPDRDLIDGDRVPLRIEVTERKHRTIATGLEYRTDEGPGARLTWEHRNMRQRGHRLRVDATVSGIGQGVETRYTIPRFLRDQQTLSFGLAIAREDTDAYTSDQASAEVMLGRKLTDRLTAGAGLRLRVSQVEQLRVRETYQLVSTPLELAWDRANDPLNPTSGFRALGRVEPFWDLQGEAGFTRMDATFTHYLALGSPDWVLATRMRLGGSTGNELARIPPDLRFFSGGGGSVRGYEYQKIGFLVDKKPTGGRSAAEFAVEVRRRLSETLGLVAFVDGGAVYASGYPSFDEDMQWGAGVGVRYFTPIGPLRFDIATPINRRKGVDPAVQFYISIGQAF